MELVGLVAMPVQLAPASLLTKKFVPRRYTPTKIRCVASPGTAAVLSNITKLRLSLATLRLEFRLATAFQVTPESVLLKSPFARVPQKSTVPLLGSTAKVSPFWRFDPLPFALNFAVTSVTAKVAP